jgi:hypothetical protein
MTTTQIAQAIAEFATNLENSITMEDRRDSVQWLAEKIGSHAANQIRNIFGLVGDYYKAYSTGGFAPPTGEHHAIRKYVQLQ